MSNDEIKRLVNKLLNTKVIAYDNFTDTFVFSSQMYEVLEEIKQALKKGEDIEYGQ